MPKLVWKDICNVFAGQLDSKEREKINSRAPRGHCF